MPKFKYKAQDEAGKTVKGVITADDEADLHVRLRADNLYLLSCEPQKVSNSTRAFKSKAVAEFCRQLGTLIAAGVSLVRSLAIIAEEESNTPAERKVYSDLLRQVRQGTNLSDALEAAEVFPLLMIYMFRAAEASGALDKTAMRLAAHYDSDYKLGAKVKSSLAYPKMLLGLIVVVLIVIMKFVLPQFEELFAFMEEKPFATKLLMGTSEFVESKWWLLALFVFGAWVLDGVFKRIPAIKLQEDKILVKLPIFGKLLKKVYTARFARTLSSLYSAGISIVNALQIARKTTGNTYIESQFDDVINFVRAGGNLSEGLDRVDGMTKKLISSIRVGEETGSLDSMLDSIADTLEYESEMAINQMTTYIEPAMIVLMGIIVLIIVAGVIMPIYDSYSGLSNTL